MTDDQESQCDEISALQSIYNDEELIVEKKDLYSGQFYAFVEVPEKFLVIYKNLKNHDDELESILVDYLPPICLCFDLPHNYPSISPPNFKLSCPWLTFKHLVYLSIKLEELWKENIGTPILYTWIDFLKTESLSLLEINSYLDIRGIFTRDLTNRSRKTLKDIQNSCEPDKKHVLDKRKIAWEERKKYTKERKNWKPRNKKYNTTFHDIKVRQSQPVDNSESQSAFKNSQDCPTSNELISLSDEPVSQKLSNLNQECMNPRSHESKCSMRRDQNFDHMVKEKFGIESTKPKFLNEITPDVLKKQWDRVERKKTSNIIALLISFSQDRTISEFKKGFYSCDICFQTQIGAKCTQFKPCNHIYCAECIHSYFEVRVSENTVQSMPCPHDKCNSEASQSQIKEVLGDELYARYDKLLLNATLDMMSDVAYCPRKACQLPVLIESDRMAYCHSCTFAFCALCLRTYHGVQPCAMKQEEKRKLAMKYHEGSSSEKALLEARYGKQQLVTLLQNVLSTDWISEHSKDCPSCKTSIEKSNGCNKMVCTKCNTIFCWLCNTVLSKEAPYKHFYDLNSKCYNQLFLGLIVSDDEEDDFEFDDDGDDDIFGVYDEDGQEFDDFFFDEDEDYDYDY